MFWRSLWISKDIFLGYETISRETPLISSFSPLTYSAVYLFISHHIQPPILSKDILWYPQWSPNTYPYIPTYLSIYLPLLIHRYPFISPSVSIHSSYFISLHLLWSSPTYCLISKSISFIILRSPATYPKISCHLSCWIFYPVSADPAGVQRLHRFTQATALYFHASTGRCCQCWQLAY